MNSQNNQKAFSSTRIQSKVWQLSDTESSIIYWYFQNWAVLPVLILFEMFSLHLFQRKKKLNNCAMHLLILFWKYRLCACGIKRILKKRTFSALSCFSDCWIIISYYLNICLKISKTSPEPWVGFLTIPSRKHSITFSYSIPFHVISYFFSGSEGNSY